MGFVIQSSDTTAINGIRQLVSLQLTAANLPDSTIAGGEFLRAAEFSTYKNLGFTDDNQTDQYLSYVGLTRVTYKFPRVFSYKMAYCPETSYLVNDIVYQGSNLYYANKAITGGAQNSINSDWTRIDVDFKGAYDTAETYSKDDVVDQGSNLYYAIGTPTVGPFILSEWTQISSNTQSNVQKDREERARISTQYETAIRLLLSLPQLIEEQILRERLRYQEIDWEKRIEFYRDEITMILEPIVPPGTIFATASAIFGEVKQFVAF